MDDESNSYRDGEYYRDSGRIPLASRMSSRARTNVHTLFTESMVPSQTTRIIDVGVSDVNSTEETNMLERLHPWPESLTCVGIHEGMGFKRSFPKHTYVQVIAGQRLPFADKAFDIAYSNAVIEHVGCDENQRAFLMELQRIARRVFVVAPNRWFPIEHHTGLPMLHWLPLPIFRGLAGRTRLAFWAREENLNFITRRKLASFFPDRVKPTLRYAGVGVGPFSSNVIAYT